MEYKVKPTIKQLQTIKKFYKLFKEVENKYYLQRAEIERRMEKSTNIKGIEFHFYGEMVGIGNAERTMALIFREDLDDKEKEIK